MDGSHKLGMPSILLVVLQEELACFLIQRRLREWLDKEAPDHKQHMSDAKIRLPVLLEHIHADVAFLCHIWMEDLCQKVSCMTMEAISSVLPGCAMERTPTQVPTCSLAFWGCVWEITAEYELHAEQASLIWRSSCEG